MFTSCWICQGAEGIIWRWICSALELLWRGHEHSEVQVFVLLSSELCREEKALPGSPPISSHLCFRVRAQFDENVFWQECQLMQSLWLPPTAALPLLRCFLCGAPGEGRQVGAERSCCPVCVHTGCGSESTGTAVLLLRELWGPACAPAVPIKQGRVPFPV